MFEIQELTSQMIDTVTHELLNDYNWRFPAASVSAVELEVVENSYRKEL